MIQDFADATTRDIFDGFNSKAARNIPQNVWPGAQRKLDMLNVAQELRDLAVPPGNRLEALKGELKGYHSIRINDQFRIVFQFIDGRVGQVKIVDYH